MREGRGDGMNKKEAIIVLAQAIILLIDNRRIDDELYDKVEDIARGYIDDEAIE